MFFQFAVMYRSGRNSFVDDRKLKLVPPSFTISEFSAPAFERKFIRMDATMTHERKCVNVRTV